MDRLISHQTSRLAGPQSVACACNSHNTQREPVCRCNGDAPCLLIVCVCVSLTATCNCISCRTLKTPSILRNRIQTHSLDCQLRSFMSIKLSVTHPTAEVSVHFLNKTAAHLRTPVECSLFNVGLLAGSQSAS